MPTAGRGCTVTHGLLQLFSLSVQTPGQSQPSPPGQEPPHRDWQPPHPIHPVSSHTLPNLVNPHPHPTSPLPNRSPSHRTDPTALADDSQTTHQGAAGRLQPLILPPRTVPRGGRTARGRTQRQLQSARVTRSLRSFSRGCHCRRPRQAVPPPCRSVGAAGGGRRPHASSLPPSPPLVAQGWDRPPANACGDGGKDGGACRSRSRATQTGDVGGWRPPCGSLAGTVEASTASAHGGHAPAPPPRKSDRPWVGMRGGRPARSKDGAERPRPAPPWATATER